MSYGIALKYNDKVPIEFFFPNGDATKFVKAKVFSSDKTLLGEFNLTNDGEGKFSYNALVMPDVDFIKVYFYVFDDVDYLVPSLVGGDIDLFYKVIDSGSGSGSGSGDDALVGILDDDTLIGYILEETEPTEICSDDLLVGYLDDTELMGYLDENENGLVGYVVEDEPLVGFVKDC